MLMKKLEQRGRSRDHIRNVYDELTADEKAEFLEALNSSYDGALVAEVIIEENISQYANELGAHKLTRAIQRYRRGETAFSKEAK